MKTKKVLGTVLGLALVAGAVGGVGYLSDGFKNWDVKNWLTEKEEIQNDTTYSIDGVEVANNAKVSMGSSIVINQSAKALLSAESSTLSLVATVLPEYAVNKTLTWSVAWASTNAANINDYVTVSASTDTHTGTITIIQGFNTQIIIKATAASGVNKTCTLDYNYRYTYDGCAGDGEGSGDWESGGYDFSQVQTKAQSETEGNFVGTVGTKKIEWTNFRFKFQNYNKTFAFNPTSLSLMSADNFLVANIWNNAIEKAALVSSVATALSISTSNVTLELCEYYLFKSGDMTIYFDIEVTDGTGTHSCATNCYFMLEFSTAGLPTPTVSSISFNSNGLTY